MDFEGKGVGLNHGDMKQLLADKHVWYLGLESIPIS
jgi:hypothetical protein